MKIKLKQWFSFILFVSLVLASVFCYLILPVLNFHPGLQFLILVTYALFAYSFWQVMHECIHYHLFAHKKTNSYAGRLLGVLWGAPFHTLKVGHLTHHAMNRERGDRTEVFEQSNAGINYLAKIRYYTWILGGLYYSEILSIFAAFMPKSLLLKMADSAQEKNPVKARVFEQLSKHQQTMRIDSIAIIILFSTSFYLYGAYFWQLLAVIMIRALMVSLFDNIYHHAAPLDKKEFAFNLELPRVLSLFFLHANYHGIHHRSPKLAWYDLPNQPAIEFNEKFSKQLILELKGPIFIGNDDG